MLIALVVVEALRTDVIGTKGSVLGPRGPEHVALALGALDNAGEKPLVTSVELTSFELFVSRLEDLLRLLEKDLGYYGIVVTIVFNLAPADLSHVDRVPKHVEDDPPSPLPAIPVPMA
ncbi:MAG: hypothetical protein M1377_02635 [Deltaproteobacteria bacterium]|nr:hypothetical protein [Deltaproteobacteria bacterium]